MPLITHLQRLWGIWWWLPLPVGAGFLALMAALGNLRPEIVVITLIATGLAIGTARTKNLLIGVLPGILIGLGYEVVRFVQPVFVTADRVLGCEVRDFERSFAAIGGETLPEFFATRHNPVFDVVFAFPYTAFWMIAVVYGIALYFIDPRRMSRYLWLLALVHLVGFVIWMILPVAPPWYVIAHGCTIDLGALPDPAGLGRLDTLFGIGYFHDFYSRSPNVFGALPSLHCAFPMAGLLAAWRDVGWRWRLVHVGYAVWMLAASVYLTHHWLVDGLLSIGIAFLAYFLVVRFMPSSATKPAGAPGQQNPSR